MVSIFYYFGLAGLFLSLSMLAPIAIGLLAGEYAAVVRFTAYLALGVFVFGAPTLAVSGRLKRLPQIGSLILIGVAWTLLPFAAALPIQSISGLSFLDSLFEAVSGMTTTGATVLSTIEDWPQALVFWRSQLQWLGAYLALLTIVLVIAPLGIGGLDHQSLSLSGGNAEGPSHERVLYLAAKLGLFFVATTALCAILLLFAGTRPFHAVTLAMTAVSTGGFLPFDGSIEDATNPFGLFVIGFFLAGAATCIFWQRMLVSWQVSRLLGHRESYFVILLIGVLTLVLTVSILRVSPVTGGQVGYVILESFTNAASVVATSGIESRPGIISLLPLVVVLFLIFLGGSAFSTSGGVKHYRFGGMVVQSWNELDRLVYPHAIHPSRFNWRSHEDRLIHSIWGFFVAAIVTIAVGTVMIAATGIPFEASITATIAAFSTAGPIYHAGWTASGEWPTYAQFVPAAKITLMAIMVLGKLEVLAVFGIFSLRYWTSR